MNLRPMQQDDTLAVLELINADHLEAQPFCDATMLDHARSGQASIDAGWWNELTAIQTWVATGVAGPHDGRETILGAVSYAVHEEGTGYLLWLHARERRDVIEALLAHTLVALHHTPKVEAFTLATPLTFGVEALPVARRPVTHQTLLDQGFVGKDAWVYLIGQALPEAEAVAEVAPGEVENQWKLTVRQQGTVAATAVVGLTPQPGVGILWWIEVEDEQRGKGIGKRLFRQASAWLYQQGARTIILYVDHDDPAEWSRLAALHLYQQAGFVPIDHFWTYTK